MKQRPGMALVNALFFAFFTAVFLVAGYQLVQGSVKDGLRTKLDAQVYNVAEGGITHAIYWLQKQAIQPVTVFDPQSYANQPDEDAETIAAEEQLGLVNEFVVDGSDNVWGRYEVARSPNAPARSPLSAGPSSPLYAAGSIFWSAQDISNRRAGATAGTVWKVRSRGYLFKRSSPSAAFSLTNPAPLKTITLEAEVHRSGFHFPSAAIYSFISGSDAAKLSGTNSHLDIHAHHGSGNTVIDAPGGVAVQANSTKLDTSTNDPPTINGSTMTGQTNASSATYVSPTLADQLSFVFGVGSLAEVEKLANNVYTSTASIPQPMDSMKIVVYKGDITFDGTPTLNGGGILVVEGNLVIDGSSTSHSWNGLIICTGDIELKNRVVINGCVMGGRLIKVHGDDNNRASEVHYSNSALDAINAQLGIYRMEKATLRAIDPSSSSVQTF